MDAISIAELARIVGGQAIAQSAGPAGSVVSTISTDSRTLQRGELFVAVAGERFDGHGFVLEAQARGAVAALVQQVPAGAMLPCVVVPDTLAALWKLAAWQRDRLTCPVITVAGANGKTTTKTMLAAVLGSQMRGVASEKSFNNHLGVPLTLLSADADAGFLVVEIGTNHLGEAGPLQRLARPDIAIVTSLAESHLEGLGDLAGVAAEETEGLRALRPGGLGIVHVDHPLLAQATVADGAQRIGFGRSPSAQVRLLHAFHDLDGLVFTLLLTEQSAQRHARLSFPGAHNALNAAACWIAARRLGLSDEQIARALARCQPPPGRSNIRDVGPWCLIDDGYNANPGSMRAALAMLAQLAPRSNRRSVAVLGEMKELGDRAAELHAELGEAAARSGVDLLIGVGPLAMGMLEAARAVNPAIDTLHFADSTHAAERLPALLKPADIVLVKGSRSVALELVCHAMERACAMPA